VEPIRKIGVADNGSDEAKAAVSCAVALAQAFDAELGSPASSQRRAIALLR
jgi:nucleotide-binding universal stress UspA family protein